MRRESRGEERLVSCCDDGDVVDVGECNGGGFGERRKRGRKMRGAIGVLDACRKGVLRACEGCLGGVDDMGGPHREPH